MLRQLTHALAVGRARACGGNDAGATGALGVRAQRSEFEWALRVERAVAGFITDAAAPDTATLASALLAAARPRGAAAGADVRAATAATAACSAFRRWHPMFSAATIARLWRESVAARDAEPWEEAAIHAPADTSVRDWSTWAHALTSVLYSSFAGANAVDWETVLSHEAVGRTLLARVPVRAALVGALAALVEAGFVPSPRLSAAIMLRLELVALDYGNTGADNAIRERTLARSLAPTLVAPSAGLPPLVWLSALDANACSQLAALWAELAGGSLTDPPPLAVPLPDALTEWALVVDAHCGDAAAARFARWIAALLHLAHKAPVERAIAMLLIAHARNTSMAQMAARPCLSLSILLELQASWQHWTLNTLMSALSQLGDAELVAVAPLLSALAGAARPADNFTEHGVGAESLEQLEHLSRVASARACEPLAAFVRAAAGALLAHQHRTAALPAITPAAVPSPGWASPASGQTPPTVLLAPAEAHAPAEKHAPGVAVFLSPVSAHKKRRSATALDMPLPKQERWDLTAARRRKRDKSLSLK